MEDKKTTIKEIYGVEACIIIDSGLIRRWNKAIEKRPSELTVGDLAMFLRQGHFAEVVVPLAVNLLKKNPAAGDIYDGELLHALFLFEGPLEGVTLKDLEDMETAFAHLSDEAIEEADKKDIEADLAALRKRLS